ncbi:MAG: N-acetyl-gamma-glutamyl-phosphate reductase [Alphaproteobacteria bacterium]|nr:N-acetyl-gamma-glutamyl-phosphate reductase [Alphaproteobacteria bacterium]
MTQATIRAAVLGASGYAGAETIRILQRHPHVEITALTAERHAGKPLGAVFPHFAALDLPDLVKIEDVDWSTVDLVFCGLPHATTQEVIKDLPAHLRILDLSADFRLKDIETYAQWYGHDHLAPELQKEAAYGLTEIYRQEIGNARIVAVPGCYPTASQLALIPGVKHGLIDADDIIIDAKCGVTGAGRAPKEGSLFAEAAEGIHAYGVAKHRHAPEIEQGLSAAAGRPVVVNFTPHLMPMNRGILATCYVRLEGGASAEDLHKALDTFYADETFVRVLPYGEVPATRHVRGSNNCWIGVVADRMAKRAIVISVIDNLVKGTSGQAIQNLNVMYGFAEDTALEKVAMFP